MFANITWQTLKPGALSEFAEAARAAEGLDITRAPGLVAHFVIFNSSERYLTIGLFDEKQHADDWATLAKEHAIRAGLASYLDDAPRASGRVSGVVVSATSTELARRRH